MARKGEEKMSAFAKILATFLLLASVVNLSFPAPAFAAATPNQVKLAKMYSAAILYCAKDRSFHQHDSSYQGPPLPFDIWACQDGVVSGCQTWQENPFRCLVWTPILEPENAAAIAEIMRQEGSVAPTTSGPNTVTENYADPSAYCAAAGTIDAPGKHYIGDPAPAAFLKILGEGSDAIDLRWRCYKGAIAICYPFTKNQACDKDLTLPGRDERGFVAEGSWYFLFPKSAVGSQGNQIPAGRPADTAKQSPSDTTTADDVPPAISDSEIAALQAAGGFGGGATASLQRAMRWSYGDFDVQDWYFSCKGNDINVRLNRPGLEGLMSPSAVLDYIAYVEKGRFQFCKALMPYAADYGLRYPIPTLVSIVFTMAQMQQASAVKGASGWTVDNPYLVAETQRRQAQAAADAQKAAAAEQLRQATQSDESKFRQFGSPTSVDFQTFAANPFLFQNQNVGLWMYLVQVISADEALFAGQGTNTVVDVKGVHAQDFTIPRELVALSLHVEGTATIPNFGIVPSGRSQGYIPCNDQNGRCGWLH